MHIPSAETLHVSISSRPTQVLYFLLANTNLMSLAEAVYAYTSSFIGPCDILICQPPQSYPPWPKRCMCMPQGLLALAIYLFVGRPNHILPGRSAECIPLNIYCYSSRLWLVSSHTLCLVHPLDPVDLAKTQWLTWPVPSICPSAEIGWSAWND